MGSASTHECMPTPPVPSLLSRLISVCSASFRRVYDALNVLEALDIIGKEKKEVKWRGFPETQSAHQFNMQRMQEQARQVEQKEMKLRALIGQFVAFRQLIERNKRREGSGLAPETAAPVPVVPVSVGARVASASCASCTSAASAATATAPAAANAHAAAASDAAPAAQGGGTVASADLQAEVGLSSSALRGRRIPMPFLLVQTQTPSQIECEMSNDHTRANFEFEHAFSIHDDSEVVRGLGLHKAFASESDLERMGLPRELLKFARGESARSIRLDAPKLSTSAGSVRSALAAVAPATAPAQGAPTMMVAEAATSAAAAAAAHL